MLSDQNLCRVARIFGRWLITPQYTPLTVLAMLVVSAILEVLVGV